MKKGLTIFPLLLLILCLDGTVQAQVPDCCKAAFNHDGVNRVAQRRKRRPRKTARKAKPKVYGIEVAPGEAGGAPPVEASPPPPPPAEAPSSPAPRKKSAPRIKPPTVMIKPPTE